MSAKFKNPVNKRDSVEVSRFVQSLPAATPSVFELKEKLENVQHRLNSCNQENESLLDYQNKSTEFLKKILVEKVRIRA